MLTQMAHPKQAALTALQIQTMQSAMAASHLQTTRAMEAVHDSSSSGDVE
jgi:hypothetical protein